MPAKQLFTNNAVSLLAAPISSTSTTLEVMAGYGALFPQPVDPGDFFLVTLENQAATSREIIRVTGRAGDILTGLQRGQEETTPQAWTASLNNDTLVDHRVTAGTLREALIQTSAEIYDSAFTTTVVASTTVLQLPSNYKPASTRLYVGGMRMKRDVDYVETSANILTINFVITSTHITAGTNIVVDYVAA